MELQQFVALVDNMRHAQRDHNRTKSDASLKRVAATEKRVDDALRELTTHRNLFD